MFFSTIFGPKIVPGPEKRVFSGFGGAGSVLGLRHGQVTIPTFCCGPCDAYKTLKNQLLCIVGVYRAFFACTQEIDCDLIGIYMGQIGVR